MVQSPYTGYVYSHIMHLSAKCKHKLNHVDGHGVKWY